MGILAVTGATSALNPNVGDLALTSDGRFFLREDTLSIVEQRLRTKFRFFKKEWFLNTNAGMPYFQHILDKPTEGSLRAIYSQVLRGTEGVEEVISCVPVLDARTRKLTVTFQVRLTTGEVLSSGSYAPFEVLY